MGFVKEHPKIVAAVGVVLVLLLCGGLSWLLIANERSATFRDVLIIVLALQSIVIGIFMMAMLWQLYQLIRLLRSEVIPLLDSTRETVDQVKHTTTFVGQSVASPLISVAGFVRGVRTSIATIRGKVPPSEYLRRDVFDD